MTSVCVCSSDSYLTSQNLMHFAVKGIHMNVNVPNEGQQVIIVHTILLTHLLDCSLVTLIVKLICIV